MNILFLTRRFWPHIGGVEKHVMEISRELINSGYLVTVITQKHDQKLKETETHQGIKIIRIPDSDSKLQIWKNLWQQRALIQAADIIHCHDIFFWYLFFRFLYPTKPVFTTFHGWEGKWPIPQKNIWLRKIWEKLSWANICIGDYLTKWYKTKANVVCYGGVSKLIRDRKSIYIRGGVKEGIFIGRLEADLGIKEYLKALKILKQKYKLTVTFVGDGSFRRQAAKLGKVTGWVKDLKPYLSRPAVIFSASYLTILEALAYNRPVLALYQNPLKKDYLYRFPGAKYVKIYGSGMELAEDFKPDLICPLGAQKFIKEQTWVKVVGQYLKLWHVPSI